MENPKILRIFYFGKNYYIYRKMAYNEKVYINLFRLGGGY